MCETYYGKCLKGVNVMCEIFSKSLLLLLLASKASNNHLWYVVTL